MPRRSLIRIALVLTLGGSVSSLFPQERNQDLFVGPPASDVLGSEDIWGNPTFVGGVANGGGTSHGVW